MIIAIDGPAGVGKSTTASLLAQRLGFLHVNSGLFYRTMTLYGLRRFGSEEIGDNVKQIAEYFFGKPEAMDIQWVGNNKTRQYVLLNEEELLEADLNSAEINAKIHLIAGEKRCRQLVNEKLAKLAIQQSLVIDGRDIGSKVFPWAEYKIFMDATIEERARRRAREINVPEKSEAFTELLKSIKHRDEEDRQRDIAPLVVPTHAIYLDTTQKTAKETVDYLARIIKPRKFTSDYS